MFNIFRKKDIISEEDKMFMQVFYNFYSSNKHLFYSFSQDSIISEKNKIIQSVYDQLGYSDIPKLLSQQEINVSNTNKDILYRGISAKIQEDLNSYINQFVSGDMFLSGRGSIFGLGIYTYYGKDKQLVDNYSNNGGSDEYGQVLEMVLTDDCKIVDIDKITKLQDYFTSLYVRHKNNIDDQFYDIYVDKFLSNPGCFAAILGYDAIKVPEKEYMVILNRTKVIVNDNILSNILSERNRSK